jgi:hypothetical protein
MAFSFGAAPACLDPLASEHDVEVARDLASSKTGGVPTTAASKSRVVRFQTTFQSANV